MKSKSQETNQKRVFLKSYPKFKQVEDVLKTLQESKNSNLQVSIIGKFDEDSLDDPKKLFALEEEMEIKCKALFAHPIDFGILSNPEIGTIFITGFLVSMFLQEIELKKIGAMLTGPYGILRGLGIDQERSTFYLKALHLGNYLIILRGFENELNQFQNNLKKMELERKTERKPKSL
ncbi:hypothetical protein [Psychroserpens luteus]|uniref:Uncharacterized protein n=1 Tax=Psychroserpens luteus TaxID=1434066 RepID=A0ABW5ZNJ1_9FLAO|nr:hypothetical protein [Psychroserpens luteus]